MDRAAEELPVEEQQLSLTDYMTLSLLSEAPDRKLGMSELAELTFLSLSGMTHVVSRLEAQGLVSRIRDEHDRRGWHAGLTDQGFAKLDEAWPSNLGGVRRYFLDHRKGFDLRALATAFEKFGTS